MRKGTDTRNWNLPYLCNVVMRTSQTYREQTVAGNNSYVHG